MSGERKTNKFGYALGLFGLTLLTQLFHGFNLSYYVDTLGMTLVYATICKIIFVIVDSVNDVIFGQLSEKTKSRWGKRIPWLVGGAIFIPIFVILTYILNVNNVTVFSTLGLLGYYMIISIFFENASTVMYVNYNALFPNLFPSTSERNKTATYKHIFELLAMILCYVLTPILVSYLKSYVLVGIIYSAIYLICICACVSSVKITDEVKRETNQDNAKYSFKETINDLFHNKPFIVYNLAQSFFAAIMALVVSMYPMYCRYSLGIDASSVADSWKQSVVLGCFFASLILSIPLWSLAIKKFTARKVWVVDFFLITFALSLLAIPKDWVGGLITVIFVGPTFGGLMLAPDMVSAELIDIDKIKHKVSREAVFGSIANIIGRFSTIISAILTAIITYLFGYKSGAEPGDNPALTFKILFGAIMPFITLLGGIFAIYYYRISRMDTFMLHELKRAASDVTTEVSISEIMEKANGKN